MQDDKSRHTQPTITVCKRTASEASRRGAKMSDRAIVAKRSGETRSDGASCIFATREGAAGVETKCPRFCVGTRECRLAATLAGETRFVRSAATEQRIWRHLICMRSHAGRQIASHKGGESRRNKAKQPAKAGCCGRGDAIRTRNRRFWRPLLYR